MALNKLATPTKPGRPAGATNRAGPWPRGRRMLARARERARRKGIREEQDIGFDWRGVRLPFRMAVVRRLPDGPRGRRYEPEGEE